MSTPSFTVFQGKSDQFGSNRYVASPVRRELEDFLKNHDKVIVDFNNVPNATQSWVDELLGKLFLREGRLLLARVQFKNCSANIQELIKFVASDRVREHEEMKSREADVGFDCCAQLT